MELWLKYFELGLPEEDAFIGAFAEWVGAKFVVSENKHFLHRLKSDAFEVTDASTMLQRLREGKVALVEEHGFN